ncbi:vWA domain-containing protein [Deinococcus ficus]|uniref:VWFA domain-containing protein n=1 Tax=Deinococcus ficus TaxID=317577 RepID=A0A221T2Y7_9DEIO|nr:vWA domain-containing protein [Deinococcus ficus]ASN83220.1 hypothetical protein DFI_18660 [Deinococcus ficus]
MITLPRVRASQAWHEQPAVRRWVTDLFRFTSRRRTYDVLLERSDDLAWVNQVRKVLYINTDIPEVSGPLRFDPGTPFARQMAWLKAVICHEAGHVRHSDLGPQQATVHAIWNSMEDERMERLMAEQYPELTSLFTYLGDVVSAMGRDRWNFSAHEGVLIWRFEHDRSTPLWQPSAEQAALWDQVRPLVEAAWTAPSSGVVSDLAWDVARLLELPVGERPAPPADNQAAPQEQAGPAGDDAGEPGDTGEPDQDGDGEAAPASGTPGQGEADAEGDGTPGAGPAGEDEGSQRAEGSGQSETEAPGEDDAGAGEGDAVDQTGTPRPPSVPDDGQTHTPQSWDRAVSASGAGEDSPEDPEPTESASTNGGQGAGQGDGTLPAMPLPVPGPVDLTVDGVEGYARKLAPLLRPKEAPGRTTPHRSRGKYSYRRDLRGREKVFEKRTVHDKPKKIFLDLLLDVSGSMHGPGIQAGRDTAMMIVRAASLCGARIRITVFNDAYREVINRPMDYMDALRLVRGITTSGGTHLSPALAHVLSTAQPAADEVHVTAVVCDGELDAGDSAAAQTLVTAAKQRGVRFIPILLGPVATNQRALHTWGKAFGHTQACPDVGSVARMLSATLITAHARMG